jgi:hypothetical protein
MYKGDYDRLNKAVRGENNVPRPTPRLACPHQRAWLLTGTRGPSAVQKSKLMLRKRRSGIHVRVIYQ